MTKPALTVQAVHAALESIPDPEIPVVSLTDLGMIGRVTVEGGAVRVELRPTFAGCPALDVMRGEIVENLTALGASRVEVALVWHPPWSTDDIRPEARQRLEAYGLAPAPSPIVRFEDVIEAPRRCPHCASLETEIRNHFGATPCRTIHFCRSCSQPFEGMKPV